MFTILSNVRDLNNREIQLMPKLNDEINQRMIVIINLLAVTWWWRQLWICAVLHLSAEENGTMSMWGNVPHPAVQLTAAINQRAMVVQLRSWIWVCQIRMPPQRCATFVAMNFKRGSYRTSMPNRSNTVRFFQVWCYIHDLVDHDPWIPLVLYSYYTQYK